jgi:hypothetical protein
MLESGASNNALLSDDQSKVFDSFVAGDKAAGADIRSKVSVIREAAFKTAKTEKIDAIPYAVRSPYSVSLPPSNDPNKNPDEMHAACLPKTAPI